ncbi:Uma2 family endonuclease [filamentous cyanobacterium CCP3]|nr:Uma2 family endonuclease [filamentous cyanobacterium CCP3]
MAYTQAKFATFEDYLAHSDEMGLVGRFQLIDGELVELPPESEPNDFVADNLQFYLAMLQERPEVANANLFPRRLVKTHTCEVQVPVLQPKDPANRFPDLVILQEEHLELTQRRLTITLDMPPPRLIAEVVSPGKTNRDRDTIHKRSQYAALGVPEYWLIDPDGKTVTVLALNAEDYQVIGTFGGSESIQSQELPGLALTAEQLFEE